MSSAIADITEPLPAVPSDSGYPTSVMLAPVFFNGSARRHRLVVRGGCLTAAACLAYLAMLGVCVIALPVTKPGDAARPAANLTGAGAAGIPKPRPAPPIPRAARPVAVPAPKAALADNPVGQGAPLVLRLALPATTRPAPSKPPSAIRPIPTSSPRHDNEGLLSKVSATPVASSTAAPPTKTAKRATH